jgi:excisionase family DNA binding protein
VLFVIISYQYTSEQLKLRRCGTIRSGVHLLMMENDPFKAMHLPPADLLTIEETASFLRLSRSTAYAMCREGQLPAFKLGKEWRIRRTDLEEIVKGNIDAVAARPMPKRHGGLRRERNDL